MVQQEDDNATIQEYAAKYEFDPYLVRRKLAEVKQQIDATSEPEIVLSSETLQMVGLAQRVPMEQQRNIAKFLGYIMEITESTNPRKIAISPQTDKESLVILISDAHIGKVVYRTGQITFDKDIFQQQLDTMLHNIIKIRTKYIKHDIDECVVLFLGDIVDGAEIYDGQAYSQDLTPYVQTELAYKLFYDFLVNLRAYFPVLRVHAVRGNHGRTSKTAPKDSNWDMVFYMTLKALIDARGDEGFNCYVSPDDYDNVNVKDKIIHIRHIGPNQTETPSGSAKFSGFYDLHGYDILCMGHFHHLAHEWHQDRPIIKNGSFPGVDDLSERMGKLSTPKQFMFCVPPDKDRPIGLCCPIYLNDRC